LTTCITIYLELYELSTPQGDFSVDAASYPGIEFKVVRGK